jgi:peptidoglycan/xylan/chitin deacetylase (PgdA/CDA1 family)
MYHSIASDVDNTLHPQIEVLREDGYDAITLSEAIGVLKASFGDNTRLSRTVVLTFDDGFLDFHTDAFPVLERAGFKATLFLASAFIGKPFITGRKCLEAAQVRALSDMGIEFGSHSVSHRRLVEMPLHEVAEELSESKSRSSRLLGGKSRCSRTPSDFRRRTRLS